MCGTPCVVRSTSTWDASAGTCAGSGMLTARTSTSARFTSVVTATKNPPKIGCGQATPRHIREEPPARGRLLPRRARHSELSSQHDAQRSLLGPGKRTRRRDERRKVPPFLRDVDRDARREIRTQAGTAPMTALEIRVLVLLGEERFTERHEPPVHRQIAPPKQLEVVIAQVCIEIEVQGPAGTDLQPTRDERGRCDLQGADVGRAKLDVGKQRCVENAEAGPLGDRLTRAA